MLYPNARDGAAPPAAEPADAPTSDDSVDRSATHQDPTPVGTLDTQGGAAVPADFDPRASRGRRHGHAPHDSNDNSAALRTDSPKPETTTLIGGRDDNDDNDDDNDSAYGHHDSQARLRPSDDNAVRQDEDMSTWTGRAAVKGGSEMVRMALLTCSSIGVSFTWGVEMTYCTPYLLSLGLTKGQTSLVWLAGPLSGLIVQPVVGVMSDGSRSEWGRRRPFIAVCSVIVAMGLFALGFTREIVGMFVHVPPPSPPADTAAAAAAAVSGDDGLGRFLTMALAVLALYVTDFAINAVMSCSRSLMVDTLPMQKQQSGAAWGGPTPTPGAGGGGGGGELSGIYFGILNIYITLPQFASTLLSTLVFAVLEPGKSRELSGAHPSEHSPTDGPNAIAICLFIGAISAIGAALATRKLKYL
ncbi:general alpha-glucoside permease [Magnaporthiopsis poae ATCC 64411]|uniref:General alpha-glucoside permease n=1 Tax=Magnaporthiopsis poae (strain ATCC 64411 / 73-15) TaxID=644358 RepID=A0A0C4DTE0_MAGP6|nr:general alpha-glucoside permease [Magnaporthiopsis poae ATCC 64411]